MAVDFEYAVQRIGIERYTDEETTRLQPFALLGKEGASFVTRLIVNPRQNGYIGRGEYPVYAADVLLRIEEIDRHVPKWLLRAPSHPDIYDFDLTASQVDSNGNIVSEPVPLAFSDGGVIYDRGRLGLPLPIRFHTMRGYFPGEREHDHTVEERVHVPDSGFVPA